MRSWFLISIGLLPAALALSGPDHQAAMNLVNEACSVLAEGDSDMALSMLDDVEVFYPNEGSAIGWAQYYASGFLAKEGRLDQVSIRMEPVWNRVLAGEIGDVTECFRFGFLYCLSLSAGPVRKEAADRALDFYDRLMEPFPPDAERAGFLYLFLAEMYEKSGNYPVASAAAMEAIRIGEELVRTLDAGTLKELEMNPQDLILRARLVLSRSEFYQGNVLFAQGILHQCRNDQIDQMDARYRADVEMWLNRCRIESGDPKEAVRILTGKLTDPDPSEDIGVWLWSVLSFTEEAVARNAVEEAIPMLAVAYTCHRDHSVMGKHILRSWRNHAWGQLSGESFAAKLIELRNSGGNLERAALRIVIAETLTRLGRPGEAVPYFRGAVILSEDPRIRMALHQAGIRCENPGNSLLELDLYSRLLHDPQCPTDKEYLVAEARMILWDRQEPVFLPEWMEENRSSIPDEVYRTVMAWWLRDQRQDYEGALLLLDPLLSHREAEVRKTALVAQTVILFRAGRESEGMDCLDDYDRAIPDERMRKQGYIVLANSLTNHVPESAVRIADRGLLYRSEFEWIPELLLTKAMAQQQSGAYREAAVTLEALVACDDRGAGTDGRLLLANLFGRELKIPDRARALYEDILSNPETMGHILARAARAWAAMENDLGNPQAGLRALERAYPYVSHSDPAERGEFELEHARFLVKAGFFDAARDRLTQLCQHPEERVRQGAQRNLEDLPR